MTTNNQSLNLLLSLARSQAIITRRFDARLGGLSEFLILYALSQAEGEKMRRIDLAEKVGLTASGVTRLLLPMEKIGLVKREANANDARVSLVMLASGGKRKLQETMERAELFAEDIFPPDKIKKFKELSEALSNLKSPLI